MPGTDNPAEGDRFFPSVAHRSQPFAPRATMIAIIGLGIFLVIVYWGQIIGWGTAALTGSSPRPW